jgi:hypothetical protein
MVTLQNYGNISDVYVTGNLFHILKLPIKINSKEGDDVDAGNDEVGDDEEEEEGVTAPPKTSGRRGGRVFDMSFTTCRDTDTLHECTTHINADGLKESITVTYECCYGYTRDHGGPGCVLTAMTDLRTTVNDMGVTEFVELLKSTDMDKMLDQVPIRVTR